MNRGSRVPNVVARWASLSLVVFAQTAQAVETLIDVRFPLELSSDHRHLADRKGVPFLYNADTPWMLFLKLTEAEAGEYMAFRKKQGFNTLQTQLTGFLGMTNRAGDRPFAGTATEQDFSKPNEAFFSHVDRVVKEARRQGLLLSIAPAWSDCCGVGWAGKEQDGSPKPMNRNGVEKSRELGRWLGRRYGQCENIMWILGVDTLDAALKALEPFKLDGVMQKMRCPFLLVHGAEDEQIPLADAQKQFDACGSKDKTFRVYTAEEGGSQHCQRDYLTLVVADMWNWFEDKLVRQI